MPCEFRQNFVSEPLPNVQSLFTHPRRKSSILGSSKRCTLFDPLITKLSLLLFYPPFICENDGKASAGWLGFFRPLTKRRKKGILNLSIKIDSSGQGAIPYRRYSPRTLHSADSVKLRGRQYSLDERRMRSLRFGGVCLPFCALECLCISGLFCLHCPVSIFACGAFLF